MDYLGNFQTTLLRLWVELYAVPGNNRRVTRWHNFIVTKHKHCQCLSLSTFCCTQWLCYMFASHELVYCMAKAVVIPSDKPYLSNPGKALFGNSNNIRFGTYIGRRRF